MFVGFVFCHFGRFTQHTGHSDKYQASQNNWWKVTLPLQSCCWFGSSLTMKCSYGKIGRWELIDNYLVLKGMFFLHSLHYSLFIFLLRVSFLVASWVAQLMDGSAGPGIKQGEGVWCWEQRGNGTSPSAVASSRVGSSAVENLTGNYLALLKLCWFCLICSSFCLTCTLNRCYMGFLTRLGFF